MKSLVAFLIIISSSLYSQKLCSILCLVEENSVYIGSNMDAPNPNSKMWIVPATEGQYARVCFGFDKEFKIAENGINEHGLFIDVNSVDKTNWKPDPEKPNWEEWEGWYVTGVPDGILAKCKNVDEAVEIFKKYNLLTFAKVKYFMTDATGKSVVIEWAKEGMKILPRSKKYQISTNFITSNYNPENYPCYRYNLAQKMLAVIEGITPLKKLRKVLSSIAMEYNSPTQFSIIADIVNLKLTVYYFHNFEETLEFEIKDLLNEGEKKYVLADLFENKSYGYKVYTDAYAFMNK